MRETAAGCATGARTFETLLAIWSLGLMTIPAPVLWAPPLTVLALASA